MVGEIEFEARLQGDQAVKAKLQALIDLQRVGLRATDEQIQKAREASATINAVTRAQNTLNRSFLAAHPALSQMIRGMSSLAHVGRSVLSIITSISTARIAALQRQENERELSQQRLNIEKQINDLLAQGVAADDPRVVSLRQELESINSQITIAKESKFQDDIAEWGNKFAIVAISAGEISNVLKNLPLWRRNMLALAAAMNTPIVAGSAVALLAALPIILHPEEIEQIPENLKALGEGKPVPSRGAEQWPPEDIWGWLKEFFQYPSFPSAGGEMGGSRFAGDPRLAPNFDYSKGGGTTKFGDVGFGEGQLTREGKIRLAKLRYEERQRLKELNDVTQTNIETFHDVVTIAEKTPTIFKDLNVEIIDLVDRTDILNVATDLNKNEVDRLTKLYGNKILPSGEKMFDSIIALAQQYDTGSISAKDLEGKVKDTGISLQTFRTILDRLGIEFSKFTGVGVGEPNPQATAAGAPITPGLHEAMIDPKTGKSTGIFMGSRVGRAGMSGVVGAASQRMSIGPGDPNYNLYADYLRAAHPGSGEQIQSLVSRGVAFQPNQDDIQSAMRWAMRNGMTIIVQGSLLTERELISKVSQSIAQQV